MTARTLMAEVSRPLDGTWDELGALLRTQRRIIRQLLRAGMDARIACGVVQAKAVKEVVAPDTKGVSAQAMVYQAIRRELDRIQAGKWSPETRTALALSGGMLSCLSQRVMQDYKTRSSYQAAQPIPVRKANTRVSLLNGAIVFDTLLIGSRRTRVVLRAGRGTDWHKWKQVANGELPYGEGKFVYNEHRKKWYVKLAIDIPDAAPLTVDPARALIVHRGVRNALTLMATTGQYRTEKGAKLQAQLRQFQARISEAKRVSGAELGSGARGHGKRRRYEHYEALSGKRHRIITTWCQQQAATVVDFAKRCGCALVVIEDYGGIKPDPDARMRRVLDRFPLYRLKQAIADALELQGMQLSEVPAHYISSTCPACGSQDTRQHNHVTGVFHCCECKLERPADFVAAILMLRSADVDSSVWDERMSKFEKLREAAREVSQ